MKKILALVFLTASVAVAAAEMVTVVVQKTSVRQDKQFFAPTVAEAKYTDRLTVLQKSGDWYQVSFQGAQGWVHGSAVAAGGRAAGGGSGGSGRSQSGGGGSPFGSLGAGLGGLFGQGGGSTAPQSQSQVSQDEVALAGKGFNQSVEQQYRRGNPRANYAMVDRMEQSHVMRDALVRFAKEGNLEPRELRIIAKTTSRQEPQGEPSWQEDYE